MKILTTSLLTIVALSFALCGCAFAAAAGATLFNAASFMIQAQEKGALTASEAKSLAAVRGNPNYRGAKLMTINRTSLESNVMSLVTPDGKVIQFIGATTEHKFRGDNGPNTIQQDRTARSWSGKSKDGGNLTISWDDEAFFGQFNDAGKHYVVASVAGGRFGFVTETSTDVSELPDQNPPVPHEPIKPIPPAASSPGN